MSEGLEQLQHEIYNCYRTCLKILTHTQCGLWIQTWAFPACFASKYHLQIIVLLNWRISFLYNHSYHLIINCQEIKGGFTPNMHSLGRMGTLDSPSTKCVPSIAKNLASTSSLYCHVFHFHRNFFIVLL